VLMCISKQYLCRPAYDSAVLYYFYGFENCECGPWYVLNLVFRKIENAGVLFCFVLVFVGFEVFEILKKCTIHLICLQ